MKIFKMMRLTLAAFMALCCMQSAAWALTASTAYTLELSKVNSDGTTTLVSTTSTTSDSTGKITFTFSNVPTQATNNFLIVTVKDSTGAVVIKSFAPAPAASGTNTLGVNLTTTAQANLMEKLGTVIGTDDPIVVAFGLMFTRDPNVTATDIDNLAIVAKEAIVNGMEAAMTATTTPNHATAAEMTAFKKALVYNATSGAKDLRSFTALTKSAVDTPAQAKADLAKASGLIADAFVDAAAAAGIDLDVILAAFDSADPSTGSTAAQTALSNLSTKFQNSMNQSVGTFFTRLASAKMKQRYSATLTTLNATSTEKTRFNTGVTALATDMGDADTLFSPYFDGTYDTTSSTTGMNETLNAAFAANHLTDTSADATPDAIGAGINVWNTYHATHSGTWQAGNISLGLDPAVAKVQEAMNYVYSKAFDSFATTIASTDAEISDMKTKVANALNLPGGVSDLPSFFGTYQGFDGTSKNWPIPQTVSVNFIASAVSAGGSFGYTPDTDADLPVPSNMAEFMGTCSDPTKVTRTACGTTNWTAGRTIFTGGADLASQSLPALQNMQQDLEIIDFNRFSIFDPNNTTTNNGNPTRAQEQAAKKTFIQGLARVVGHITGTQDGTTAFTDAQKKALVQAQQQPSLD